MLGFVPTLDAVLSELNKLASERTADGQQRYLFRGEREAYPQTYSSIDRLYHDATVPGEVHDELDSLTAFAMTMPLGDQLPAKLAGAFAQHYGLPTQVFDFTASPRVAVNFAATRAHHPRPHPKLGVIGVLDVERAVSSNRVALFDLTNFAPALRARKQLAFGMIYSAFVADDHVDLKRHDLAEPIGLEWKMFGHLPDDETFLYVTGNDDDFESDEGDVAAGIPQRVVDEFVSRHGRLSAMAATIIAKRIRPIGRTIAENVMLWSGH